MDFNNWMAVGQLWLVKFFVPLAWPLVVLIALLVLRKDISALLARIKTLNTPAGGFSTLSSQDENLRDTAGGQFNAADAAQHDPALQDWIRLVHTQIASTPLQGEALFQRVILALALSYQNVAYLEAARVIFGTQVQLLTIAASGMIIDENQVDGLYALHVARAQGAGFAGLTKDAWLDYLTRNVLLTRLPMGVQITPQGHGLAHRMMDMGEGGLAKAY